MATNGCVGRFCGSCVRLRVRLALHAPAAAAVATRYLGGSRRGLATQHQPTILSLVDVVKRLPDGSALFENVSVSIQKGAKIGLLGPNGAGKSSLLKVLAGTDPEFEGERRPARDIRVAYLPQEPELDPTLNVIDNIRLSLANQFKFLEEFEAVSAKFAEEGADFDHLIAEQQRIQEHIDEHDLWNLERRIAIAMKALCCPKPDSAVTTLSGGERRRIALAGLLLQGADLLLLDEPTNHLDVAAVAWLEQYLGMYKGAVIAITHDRYFLDNITQWIAELDAGRIFSYRGNYASFLQSQAQRRLIEHKTKAFLAASIEDELNWIRRGGRKTGNKARMKSYKALSEKSQTISSIQSRVSKGKLIIPPGPRLGNRVLSLRNISIGFDGRELIKDLTLVIEPGAVVGVVGRNGIGKTTLLRLIVGDLSPHSGTIELGQTVRIGFVTQSRQCLDPSSTVCREIVPDLEPVKVGLGEMQARHYVAQFNFRGRDQQKLIGTLSGGERNRVHLAKLLKDGCNLLLLDEPTNDLDVATLRSLEEGLHDFPGCAVVVSHDRWFLDRTCTHILSFEGNGVVKFFNGNYTEFEESRKSAHKNADLKRASFQSIPS